MFFGARKRPSTHHDYHAIHHNFTIKKPRSALTFLKTPFKKRP